MDNKLDKEKVALENSEAQNQENMTNQKTESNNSGETVVSDAKRANSVFEGSSENSTNVSEGILETSVDENNTNVFEGILDTSADEDGVNVIEETSENGTNDSEDISENGNNEDDLNIPEETSENGNNENDTNISEGTSENGTEEIFSFAFNPELKAKENMLKNLVSSKGNILILLSLIISTLLGIYFIFFYNNSIVGTWVVDNSTGKDRSVSTYLEFQKDGIVSVKKESIQVFGKYELKPDNKVNIDISIDGKEASAGEFTYTVKSDFTSRKLELVRESGKLTEYTQCKEIEKMSLKNFNGNDNILGSWVNTNYNLEYEFLDNGVAYVILPNVRISMLYTIENDSITFVQYKNNSPLDNTMQYSLDGDTLLLNGIKYTRK